MPSGKQILISELQKLSQRSITEEDLNEASDRFRAGLLLHGSTANSAWPTVERVSWVEEDDVQGPALSSNGVFLADLLSALMDSSDIPETIKEHYPDLTLRDYRAGFHVISLLITQLHYFPELSSVENNGDLDTRAAEELISNCIAKLKRYRSDPQDHMGGQSIESAEAEI